MFSKFTRSSLLFAIFIILFPILTYGQTKNSSANYQQQIDRLQREIDALKKQNKQKKRKQKKRHKKTVAHKKKKTDLDQPISTCIIGESAYNPERVTIGSYLNADSLYNGSDLVINIPSVRESARLLLRQVRVDNQCVKLGIPLPKYPRLVFSGNLAGQYVSAETYQGSSVNNINFSGAELDTYVQVSPWISGYMALDYDSNELRNGSRVFLNRAFITVGDLNRAPVYGVVGQIYVPFGRFSSAFITAPTTLALGRTRARAIMLGLQQTGDNAGYGEVYGFQGLTEQINTNNTTDEWGADVGYTFKLTHLVSGYIGVSYMSNLADSQGAQSTVFLTNESLDHRVPAGDIYGSFAVQPFVVIAEYVTAFSQFHTNDAPFANHGAKPHTYHIELDLTFNTLSKPSSIGVGYDRSQEALAFGLPKERIAAVYNINIWKDTNLALEYRHDNNYPSFDATTTGNKPTSSAVVADLGRSDNVFTFEFDLYF